MWHLVNYQHMDFRILYSRTEFRNDNQNKKTDFGTSIVKVTIAFSLRV
jgi:hypothetical protein